MACSSDRSREAIRKEAWDVSGMADLRTWETEPEESRTRIQVFHQKGNQISFLKDQCYLMVWGNRWRRRNFFGIQVYF